MATCDVLIVGSGLMGASVARLIRQHRADARIVMVDAGPELGPVPGQHLQDAADGQTRAGYAKRVSSGIQGLYVGADEVASELGGLVANIEPGLYRLSTLGEDSAAMPNAAAAWNTGGMSVHWTGATPAPWGSEIPECIPRAEWERDLATAATLLKVNLDPHGESTLRNALIAAVNEVFAGKLAAGREAQPLPMAAEGRGETMLRTGPNRIFPAIAEGSDPNFELRPSSQVLFLEHDGSSVAGAIIRDLAAGEEYVLNAAATVVCADVFRTPQVLFASKIRPRALGRYLNEHMFLTGRSDLDPSAIGLSKSKLAGAYDGLSVNVPYWLPHSGPAQPFNGQLSGAMEFDEDGGPIAASAGLALYVPTEVRPTSRVEFSETEVDALGLPKMTVIFDYSDSDRHLLDRAMADQQRIARRFGATDSGTDSLLLPPGTSLHMTGTVRMGPVDDGTSVCDPDGRVWGFANLYLAGCGVMPTALVANSTFASATTAVRAARAAARCLGARRLA